MTLSEAAPRRRELVSAIILATLLALGSAGSAAAGTEHLCVVPVPDVDKDGQTSHGEAKLWHGISRVETFSGSRWPVMITAGYGAVRLDEQRRLHRVTGFPSNVIWDQFTVEPSDRVIGVTNFLDRIYLQNPADGLFHPLETQPIGTVKYASDAQWSDAFDGTLISTANGVLLLRGNRLEAIAAASGLKPGRLIDLPRHRIVALPADGGLTLLYPDGTLRELTGFQLRKKNYISRVVEHDGGLLVLAHGETYFVPLREHAGVFVPDEPRRLVEIEGDKLPPRDWYDPSIGQYFIAGTEAGRYFGKRKGLWHVADGQLVPIEGSEQLSFAHGFIVRTLASGQTIVVGGGGIHRYERAGPLKRIGVGNPPDDSAWGQIYDLQGSGSAILRSKNSLGELGADDKVVPIPLPPELEGATIYSLYELPASQAVIILSNRGVFAMDASRAIAPVRGGADLHYSFMQWRLLGRDELLLSSRRGPYLMLDERIAGPGACDPKQ